MITNVRSKLFLDIKKIGGESLVNKYHIPSAVLNKAIYPGFARWDVISSDQWKRYFSEHVAKRKLFGQQRHEKHLLFVKEEIYYGDTYYKGLEELKRFIGFLIKCCARRCKKILSGVFQQIRFFSCCCVEQKYFC